MSIPIDKTLEQIRTDMFARIAAVQAEYQASGWLPAALNLNKGIFRGLIELWCWAQFQLYTFLVQILGQAFPASASGTWLDLHCKQVGVIRKSATRAAGTVYFLRDDTSGNIPIPAGRIVKTLPDGNGDVYRYMTTEDVVLPDGSSEVAVPVQAEGAGAGYNATSGQISEITTVIDGVDGVENRSDWLESEGTDDETDAALFERYQLKWMEGAGYTKYAYKSWALSVSGVVEVSVLDQHPRGQGTVDVIVRGSAGVPTQQVLDEVEAILETESHMNDDVETRGVAPVTVDIEATLEYKPGYVAGDILASAEQKIQALFDPGQEESGVTPVSIGEDLELDRLTAAVMLVPGVKSTPWTLPASSVSVDGDELLVLGTLTLSATEASEA
jgi:uncharacterized phage protein gp47/JayE